jgi:predicted GIY-YIG superfamily endonuclease
VQLPVRTALYRHFDAEGQLLYVGISLSAVQRLAQHKTASEWFRRIARVEIEWHPCRRDAEQAERRAIATENPICNRARPAPYVADVATVAAPDWGWQIVHLASGRRDGNYFDAEDAQAQFVWWSSTYPGERFSLVRGDGPARPELRPYNRDEWSTAA